MLDPEKILVTKSFLPPKEEYKAYIDKIWNEGWLTNNGPLVKELEAKIKDYIGHPYISYVNNGTIAIQLALKVLGLKGSVITTPFSYCATTTTLLWENLEPIFVDINESDLNINPDLIEGAIRADTVAILATHVYGSPCEVEKIQAIAEKYNLKVIYDAAHAFGVTYKGKSLLKYGDISTCSFHATKVFHTIEGGCVLSQHESINDQIGKLKSFGHIQDEYYVAGINGKNSEFHAAMGLVNFNYLDHIISERKAIYKVYDENLDFSKLHKPTEKSLDTIYNYAYYPIVFRSKNHCNKIIEELEKSNIFPRRYFFPSLNRLKYITDQVSCPISESVSERVLSLPLYVGLSHQKVKEISSIINANS